MEIKPQTGPVAPRSFLPTPLNRTKWVGSVLSFEQRVRFGKHLPTPWWKHYEVWAESETEAGMLLARKAQTDGYALGGVQNIQRKEG